jgi:hypothetical protein
MDPQASMTSRRMEDHLLRDAILGVPPAYAPYRSLPQEMSR